MNKCNMMLITQQGCPACKFLEEKVLPFEDVGIDRIHIDNSDKSQAVSKEYPEVKHVPTLIMDCNGKKDYFVGVENISSMLLPKDGSGEAEDEEDDYNEVDI